MEGPVLTDQKEYPSDDVLARHLGRAKAAWEAFNVRLAADVSDASLEWRYYNDGKAWFCKVVRKKKTVCWVSIWAKYFKAAFYFTAKCDEDIAGLPIDPGLKAAYKSHAPIGPLKPLVVEVRTKKALDPVFVLAEYKIGQK